MVHNKNTNKLFADLGKATKRGIRKCYKCGEVNGTRGYSCKNKQCDVIFKEYSDRRKINLEAVKLTGTTKQLYSVRVRDKGPDHRGFVQLPYGIPSHVNLLTDNAICFVDSCQRLFDDSILRCHETDLNNISSLCVHVESALQSEIVATQINLKESALNLIKIPCDVKQKLWELISSSQGTVIQRVSKHVMVVKCMVSAKHPLGYLHFTFSKSKGKDVFDKFICGCFDVKVQNDDSNHKCIHYYACVCSFASNSRLTEEFMNFINLEFEIGFTRIHFKNIRAQKNSAFEDDKNLKEPKIKVKRIKRVVQKTNLISSIKTTRKQLNLKKTSTLSHLTINNVDFANWFVSVIELLNTCIRRNPENNFIVLVFYIPQNFFDSLIEKVNIHSPDNILPRFTEKRFNNTSDIILYRYVWQLSNFNNVCKIFSSQKVSLDVSKLNVNVPYRLEKSINIDLNQTCQVLVIEWMPNVLEISKFGELKLKFDFAPH